MLNNAVNNAIVKEIENAPFKDKYNFKSVHILLIIILSFLSNLSIIKFTWKQDSL